MVNNVDDIETNLSLDFTFNWTYNDNPFLFQVYRIMYLLFEEIWFSMRIQELSLSASHPTELFWTRFLEMMILVDHQN